MDSPRPSAYTDRMDDQTTPLFPLDIKISMRGEKREGGPTAAELEAQREEATRGPE